MIVRYNPLLKRFQVGLRMSTTQFSSRHTFPTTIFLDILWNLYMRLMCPARTSEVGTGGEEPSPEINTQLDYNNRGGLDTTKTNTVTHFASLPPCQVCGWTWRQQCVRGKFSRTFPDEGVRRGHTRTRKCKWNPSRRKSERKRSTNHHRRTLRRSRAWT